jgi:hypothetical protein
MTADKRFAVLIDADNVSDKHIKRVLDEISNEGTITYKRIYGDWTKPVLASWKSILLEHSITPIQQYGYTTGKNSTDSAMIIDAMDILYANNVEGFCIVSSDSDFTRLASRLRESGMSVVGMGERKTPKAFIAACNRFIYLEVLGQNEPEKERVEAVHDKSVNGRESLESIKREIATIVNEISDDDGWAPLSTVGNILIKRKPDFDVRNYGDSKLTALVRRLGSFEIDHRETKVENVKHVYIRNKPVTKP